MNITINTISIYDYALALTARAGSTSESYEDVALTEDNYPMLDVYLSSGVSHAEGELRRKLADSNSFDLKVTEENVGIVLDDAVRRDLAVLHLAETSIRLFLGYYIAAEWLRPTPAGALSEMYSTTAATHLQTAVNALNQREETRVIESDYSNRQDEGNVRMDAKSGIGSDYSRRKSDDVLARPGMRIGEHELLTLQSEECCFRSDPAVSDEAELLITKP